MAFDQDDDTQILNNTFLHVAKMNALTLVNTGGAAIGNGGGYSVPIMRQTIAFNHMYNCGNHCIFIEAQDTTCSTGVRIIGNYMDGAETVSGSAIADHGFCNTEIADNQIYDALIGIDHNHGLTTSTAYSSGFNDHDNTHAHERGD